MRYILAGGPSCGKTSLVNELRKRGYTTVDEAAREVIEEGRVTPKTHDFQLEIFRRQLEREEKSSLPAFFDRSALEGIAYSRIFLGEVHPEIDNFEYKGRYSSIFVLERLPFVVDGIRIEKSDEEAEEVHLEIIKTYRERGYSPIFIPTFLGGFSKSIRKRADYLISKVGELNGN